jgi:hypothetical protein
MAMILSPTELRDAVAWLSENKDKKAPQKKWPQAEVVKP